MLKLRYKQIKTCPLERKDIISQEITILQAVNTKDKSSIPGYLQYRDKGYMYFPHYHFIPFFRRVDHVVKSVVNCDGFNKHGEDFVKVHKSIVFISIIMYYIYRRLMQHCALIQI